MREIICVSDLEFQDGLAEIYFAGGCFWAVQHLMQTLKGVVKTESGYANGESSGRPSYEQVCTGKTGFRETVRVLYDPKEISLDALLFVFFAVIDPTAENRQGHDVGTQYQAGVYYTDEASALGVKRIAAIERARAKSFAVEILPLKCFYKAEAYHQDYLVKNPGGYCHIPRDKMALFSGLTIDPADYRRPDDELIGQRLSQTAFAVTQQNQTEPPFENAFWDSFEKGLYVDVVTGEPLFSSKDKFESACGWPSFSRGVEGGVLVQQADFSHGMKRTEVRSRAGNSHLGHVFLGEKEAPEGVRYCINSAALRFIPLAEMDEAGYGALKKFVE